MEQEMRLSKLMAMRGLCSRREADKYIEQGAVVVDGIVVDTLGSKVRESVRIELTWSSGLGEPSSTIRSRPRAPREAANWRSERASDWSAACSEIRVVLRFCRHRAIVASADLVAFLGPSRLPVP